MKRTIKAGFLLICLTISTSLLAAGPNKSIGLIAGIPTGISFKYWMEKGFIKGPNQAIDIGVGWRLVNNVGVQVKADYVVHKYGLIPVEFGKLPIYYGLGLRTVITENNDTDLGIRIPVGANYLFEDEPFGVFVEVAPVLLIVPSTDLHMSMAIGGRYRFR